MQFTPPPPIKKTQVEVIIESGAGEHRVVVSNAGSYTGTNVRIRAQLSDIGWEVDQMRCDAYSVSLEGASLESIMVLCKEIRSGYGLSAISKEPC